MNILHLSDILNVHDERLIKQFLGAGHGVTLLTFFHRAPELPKFIEGIRVIHERYQMYPDGNGASRWKLIHDISYKRDEARIRDAIEPLRRDRMPFAEVPPALRRGVRWVEPRLVAEVQFRVWTPDGRLRHARWLGMRAS